MVERKESVRVSAAGEDFKKEFRAMVREAAELNAALRAIPNRVTVNAHGRGFEALEAKARQAERSSSLLVDSLVSLGPAVLPIGAVAVPALAGLSAQLGFTVGAAGTAVLAFNGIGDALKALNEYRLDPTGANLDKLNESMHGLGPAARDFVRQLDAIGPSLQKVRQTAQNGLVPGVGEGIDRLLVRLPEVRSVIGEISRATGTLAEDAGQALAGPGFDQFFDYLRTEARPLLLDLGGILGNLAKGMANLFVGTAPQQREFSTFLLDAARGFEEWSAGLAATEGFNDFLTYLAKTGPQFGEALGSIGNALVQITQAAAPLSGPTLQALSAVADVMARIADSPVGTPLIALASGLALLNRALVTRDLARGSTLAGLLSGRTQRIDAARASVRGLAADLRTANSLGAFAGTRALASPSQVAAGNAARARLGGVAKSTALVGGLAFAASGLAEKMNLSNTATLALAGSLAGPWGAAVGGGIGLVKDLAGGNDDLAESVKSVREELLEYGTAGEKSIKDLQRQLDQDSSAKGVFKRVITFDLDQSNYTAGRRALDEAGAASTRRLAASQEALRYGFELTAAGADAAGASIEDFAASVTAANDTLSGRAAMRDYEAALDDFASTVKESQKTLRDGQSLLRSNGKINIDLPEGRAVQAALDNIASTSLRVGENLKGLDRARYLQRARRQFIDAAGDLGITRGAAKRLADDLGLLSTIRPKVKVGVTGIAQCRSAVQQFIDDMSGKKINIGVITKPASGLGGLLNPTPNKPKAGGGGGGKSRYANDGAPERYTIPPQLYAPSAAPVAIQVATAPLPPISVTVDSDFDGRMTAIARFEVDGAMTGAGHMTRARYASSNPGLPSGLD